MAVLWPDRPCGGVRGARTLMAAKGRRMPASSMQMLCARRCSTSRTSAHRPAASLRSAPLSVICARAARGSVAAALLRLSAQGCTRSALVTSLAAAAHASVVQPSRAVASVGMLGVAGWGRVGLQNGAVTRLEQALQVVEVQLELAAGGLRPHRAGRRRADLVPVQRLEPAALRSRGLHLPVRAPAARAGPSPGPGQQSATAPRARGAKQACIKAGGAVPRGVIIRMARAALSDATEPRR